MKKIAIITARSGSKGLKDKNILDLCGKPLIAYTIEAARQSGIFNRIIVSTDSDKYADISRHFGAEVMMRGKNLSNDTATSFMVIKDVLSRIGEKYDYFVLLQPTSPMRNATHIKEAAELFESRFTNFNFLVSMKEAEHAKILVNPIEEDGSLKYFDTDFANYCRQSFKDYSPNGAIFMAKPEEYLQSRHFFGQKSLAYIMTIEDSIDIDYKIDLELAKVLMQIK